VRRLQFVRSSDKEIGHCRARDSRKKKNYKRVARPEGLAGGKPVSSMNDLSMFSIRKGISGRGGGLSSRGGFRKRARDLLRKSVERDEAPRPSPQVPSLLESNMQPRKRKDEMNQEKGGRPSNA